MKLFSRALLAALVLLLGACEDPFDRMQGEPGEDDNCYTGETLDAENSGEGEASSEGRTEAGGEAGEAEATEEGGEH